MIFGLSKSGIAAVLKLWGILSFLGACVAIFWVLAYYFSEIIAFMFYAGLAFVLWTWLIYKDNK